MEQVGQWNEIIFNVAFCCLKDSVYVLASAIKEMMKNETITEPPKNCDDSGVNWESGEFANSKVSYSNRRI